MTEHALPAGPREPGIHLFAWRLWWWMSWLLPALFVFGGFFSGGGWIAFALLLFSWIILPIAGLLGMLPQIVLRRRGYRSTPGPVTSLLFLNWWSWLAMVVSLTDFGDTGETTSFVRTTLGLPITETGEQVIFVIAVFFAILSWIAVLVLSFTVRRADADGVPAARWTPLAWATAFGAPALLVLGIAVGSLAGAAGAA
ncbi:hypothetical protein [Microbacterium hydrocarbonoxydans]|uniref:hypothetical protein n=1 Tax=Microbacterium hydrocarbonoxydans TaxID=273678 RepID=UPI0013DC551E|nr:hypothetical protein [Microbacterium hydrocarbonoxydans]